MVQMEIVTSKGEKKQCALKCRLDTEDDLAYFSRGGIMPFVLDQLLE